jgi:Tfp pilus assembly protein PilO
MKKQIPLTPVIAAALAVVLIAGYVVLIKPQRDSGTRLDQEIAALETSLEIASAPARPDDGAPEVSIEYADLFRLAKAMPDEQNMAGIMLELDTIAASAGVKFLAIQPMPPLAKGSFTTLPISLTFDGNYYDLTDFLYRIRNLVTVRNGTLDATGRLYTLDSLDMHESKKGFPKIEAQFTLAAYVFGSAPVGAAGQAPAETTTTAATTASTETTPATTEPAATTTEPAPAQPPPAQESGADEASALGVTP